MEINLIRFIPIILYKVDFYSTESAIKYFLVQAIASIIIIIIFLTGFFIYNFIFLPSRNAIIIAALAIKAGLAPFHFWFPQIILNINWIQAATVITWQKAAPIFLISSFYNNFFVHFIIFSSGFIGFLGGFNQILIKIILAYSSIIHSAWIVILSSISIKFLVIYFLTYLTLTLALIYPCYRLAIERLMNIRRNKFYKTTKIIIIFSILSLAGLPPFIGFIAKLIAIKLSIFIYPHLIIISLIIFSLISLVYYFKLLYNITTNFNQQPSFINYKNNYFNPKILWTRILFNIFMPLTIIIS